MSNALRNAAESTVHAISDLVDDARDRIDDLPPLGRGRQRKNTKRWTLSAVVLVVGLLIVMAGRRRHQEADDSSATGGRMAEKSLAVS